MKALTSISLVHLSMTHLPKNLSKSLLATMALLLSGCAGSAINLFSPTDTVTEKVDHTADYPIDIYDPWEGYNRRMYIYNAKFDRYVFIPIVEGYEAVMPDIAEQGVSNFFSNLGEVSNVINSALQLKPTSTLTGLGRFGLNSTVGLLGLWDPATKLGLLEKEEDFGQTLGYWGAGAGPFLILPIAGPSSLRDASGTLADFAIDNQINLLKDYSGLTFSTVSAINSRHEVKFRYLQGSTPFEYEALRYLYLKKRELDVLK
ncbi:MAG: VacJ family lipoprotein [Marinobacterium sp.]|nr:VacJ family lipoprotein [Marinobacterium sp.]